MRAMLPAEFQPSTIAGSTMARKESNPETGKSLNLNANRYCKTSAVMKTGMDTPISAPPINRRSSSLFWRTAATMPATIPMIQATTAASRDSFTVFGNASRIIFVTFRLSRYDVPKSPRSACAIYWKNCTYSGLSSPISLLIFSMTAGFTCSPIMVVTGSPGTIRSIIKMRSTTPTSTGMEIRIRLSIFFNTPYPATQNVCKYTHIEII